MTKTEKERLKTGLLFISPWIAGFILFIVYPLTASFYWSFCDYDVLASPIWIGASNYQDMLSDEVFWKSLYNTLFFAAFALPTGLITSLFLAVLLNCNIRGRSFFRAVYFLPSLVPIVASTMIWLWIFNGKYGLLNNALEIIGIDGPNWLTDELWTKPALVIMTIWSIGNSVVIYLAALQDVPSDIYEAAHIDGATALHRFIYITIPLISPVIYFNLIMGIIGTLQIFAQPYIMFQGGSAVNRSALFYTVYLFQNAFSYHQMGYACAMAWILFIIIILLTWLATKSTRKYIFYR
jgi:multiple sugar transport system permease protein